MLRIVKWRSPMSMGTWGLSVFASLTGLVAAHQVAEDGLLGREKLSGPTTFGFCRTGSSELLAAPFGVFVGAYTGVLIALTSTPIWARNAVLMGPLFITSAMSTGLSAISFLLHLFGAGEEKTLEGLRRAEKSSLLIEGGLLAASLYHDGAVGQAVADG